MAYPLDQVTVPHTPQPTMSFLSAQGMLGTW